MNMCWKKEGRKKPRPCTRIIVFVFFLFLLLLELWTVVNNEQMKSLELMQRGVLSCEN